MIEPGDQAFASGKLNRQEESSSVLRTSLNRDGFRKIWNNAAADYDIVGRIRVYGIADDSIGEDHQARSFIGTKIFLSCDLNRNCGSLTTNIQSQR